MRRPVGRLRSDLQHLPYRDIAHHLQTIDRYTTLAAQQMRERGVRVGVAGADGAAARRVPAQLPRARPAGGTASVGLVVSVLNSYYVFLKFAKLWETQRARRMQRRSEP